MKGARQTVTNEKVTLLSPMILTSVYEKLVSSYEGGMVRLQGAGLTHTIEIGTLLRAMMPPTSVYDKQFMINGRRRGLSVGGNDCNDASHKSL